MSSISYQIDTILLDKILLANKEILSIQEIIKLKKQGMIVRFFLKEEDVSELIIKRSEFFQLALEYKAEKHFESLVAQWGLIKATTILQVQYVTFLVIQERLDLKKVGKHLKMSPSEIKDFLKKAGFEWDNLWSK